MKAKMITVQRIKKLGNYESERLEITREVYEGDDLDKTILDLRLYVREQLTQSLDREDSKDPNHDPIPF